MRDERDALIDENRSLRREVRLLRQEVTAFRSSRWWRLHPRVLLGRRSRASAAAEAELASQLQRDSPEDARIGEAFHTEVLSQIDVTRDDFTSRLPGLDPIVGTLASATASVLEIGSYEGMSACYLLWRLPHAHITCIDVFEDRDLERRFDANVSRVDPSRVTKIVDDSRRALLELQADGALFDLIYVDGSHLGLDVLVDGALAWRVLAQNGIMVFDDYRWNDEGNDALLRPGPAIDSLLGILAGKYELLERDAQVAIRKRSLRD
jgi:predicted O-methyltransferase YrrM